MLLRKALFAHQDLARGALVPGGGHQHQQVGAVIVHVAHHAVLTAHVARDRGQPIGAERCFLLGLAAGCAQLQPPDLTEADRGGAGA